MREIFKTLLVVIIFFLSGQLFFGHVPSSLAQTDKAWTEPINLSLSGTASNPMLVIDSENVVHALWVDDLDGHKYSQSLDGITWTKPRTVRFPFNPEGSLPTMLSATDGLIHVFWIDSEANLSYAKTTALKFANPLTWQITTRLAQDVLDYEVIEDSRGALHLAYVKSSSSELNPAGVYYQQSIIGGGIWVGAIKLYESEYFRSITPSESFVSLSAGYSSSSQQVYVTWDNRPEKRVYMAISSDAGIHWSEAKQIKGPQDTSGMYTPFNLSVMAVENKALLMWQVGEPGSDKCSIFSQWSEDGGETWQAPKTVFGATTICPTHTRFLIRDTNYIVALMTGQGDPNLLAWNGQQWSRAQEEVQLPTFVNPLTLDTISMGCRFDLLHQDRLYLVGCDQGQGKDVWFSSRSLEPLKDWLAPASNWGVPTVISGESEGTEITNLLSTPDPEGNLHVMWVSSPSDESSRSIQYANWDGAEWNGPHAVNTSSKENPVEMSLFADIKQRLLLTWVDGSTGDLFFNWAGLDKANLESEWKEPVLLPSPSGMNSTPDLVADGAGRIVVAYTVPINEERGVYLVQSTDSGKSWSNPTKVFDAVSAGWERVEGTKICLGPEGVLHLTFNRTTTREGQPVGLYYSRSTDGGAIWSDVQMISKAESRWSELICYDEHTTLIVWQEHDGYVFANLSRVSKDSGMSWDRVTNVTGVSDNAVPVSLTSDGLGQTHFVQLLQDNADLGIKQDNRTLQDWTWTGSTWKLASDSNVTVQGDRASYSITTGITSNGFLEVLVSANYFDFENQLRSEIQSFNRYLGVQNTGQDSPAVVIPTPFAASTAIDAPAILPTQSADLTILYDDNVSVSPRQRNIVGIVIIGLAMIGISLLFIRGRPRSIKK